MTIDEWNMLECIAPVLAWLNHSEIVERALEYIVARREEVKSSDTFHRWTADYLSAAKREGRNMTKKEAEEEAKQLQERELKLIEFMEGIFKDAQEGKIPSSEELLKTYTQPCPFSNGKTKLYTMIRHYAASAVDMGESKNEEV
jgi:hypothetical protein